MERKDGFPRRESQSNSKGKQVMGTYSFIAEFKGRVYLSCYQCERSLDAFSNWVNDFISWSDISKMQRKRIIEDSLDNDLAPSPLEGLNGIWCWWINPWGKSLLLNFMETLEWDDDSAHTYTFIVLYEGGTYISQHRGVDYDDSVRLWLEYFITSPYLNDLDKENMLSSFARCFTASIEVRSNFYNMHLLICNKQLDLYIAKTKINET